MAKLAEQAGRYDEMVKATAAIAKMNVDLTVEERSLLSVAYKNAVGARRASWKIISSIEQKEAESDKASIITEYRAKVRTVGGPTYKGCRIFSQGASCSWVIARPFGSLHSARYPPAFPIPNLGLQPKLHLPQPSRFQKWGGTRSWRKVFLWEKDPLVGQDHGRAGRESTC